MPKATRVMDQLMVIINQNTDHGGNGGNNLGDALIQAVIKNIIVGNPG